MFAFPALSQLPLFVHWAKFDVSDEIRARIYAECKKYDVTLLEQCMFAFPGFALVGL